MSFSALQVYQWGCRSINLFSKQTGAALVSKLRNGTSRISLLPFLHRSPCLPEVEFTAHSRNLVDNTLLYLAESAASFDLTKWGLEMLCRAWKWFKRLVATVSGLVAPRWEAPAPIWQRITRRWIQTLSWSHCCSSLGDILQKWVIGGKRGQMGADNLLKSTFYPGEDQT